MGKSLAGGPGVLIWRSLLQGGKRHCGFRNLHGKSHLELLPSHPIWETPVKVFQREREQELEM